MPDVIGKKWRRHDDLAVTVNDAAPWWVDVKAVFWTDSWHQKMWGPSVETSLPKAKNESAEILPPPPPSSRLGVSPTIRGWKPWDQANANFSALVKCQFGVFVLALWTSSKNLTKFTYFPWTFFSILALTLVWDGSNALLMLKLEQKIYWLILEMKNRNFTFFGSVYFVVKTALGS